MNSEIYDKIKTILSESLHVKDDTITPDSELVNDLGINSLELADLVFNCEDAFEIEIDDNDIAKFTTVRDVVDYIETKV